MLNTSLMDYPEAFEVATPISGKGTFLKANGGRITWHQTWARRRHILYPES